MKKLFALIILTALPINAQIQGPRIFSPKPNHDFGEILEGQVVSHLFEIQNTGDSDLKISEVRASCGCTAAQPSKKILKPNEKTTIKVEFDSANRLGLQQKYVSISSNDPQNKQFRLSFMAVVVDKLSNPGGKTPKIEIQQNVIDFGTVEEGKIAEAKVTFKNTGDGILEIRDVKTSCGCTAALLSSKKLQPGESGTLRIELDTSRREGKLTRTVTLITNDPVQANHTITLNANIQKRK